MNHIGRLVYQIPRENRAQYTDGSSRHHLFSTTYYTVVYYINLSNCPLSSFASFIPGFETILLVCGLIGITFSAFALLGGIMAIQRKMWGLALVGSILGLFIIGPVFISSLLSLIALILIAITHREFT